MRFFSCLQKKILKEDCVILAETFFRNNKLITIRESFEDISLTLVAELPMYSNMEITLSLLEDIKKQIISQYQKNVIIISDITLNGEISNLNLNIPISLHKKLLSRTEAEKCSINTLCVHYLSNSLTGIPKHLKS